MEHSMDTPTLTNRRNRQQARRVLADLRTRWRDLSAPAGFRTELDLLDRRDRLVIPHPTVFARSRS
jgi:hypothetical protein